ncbi:transcriptional repressor [Candidatus Uhrbacteria bacterium]|jgi:Fe2+ or Zn2+ uptake regulation protein|nr:MAG: transcriptional repressor [Candidatus Uhrbacteria bacterium]
MQERQTKSKLAIREVLSASQKPMAAMELVEALGGRGLSVNKTTVYRELEKLLLKGEISEVDFADGQKRYEMTHGDHHHHAVCMSCEAVVELEIEPQLEQIQSSVAKQSGFRIQKHLVEFFGMCGSCSKTV